MQEKKINKKRKIWKIYGEEIDRTYKKVRNFK